MVQEYIIIVYLNNYCYVVIFAIILSTMYITAEIRINACINVDLATKSYVVCM